MIGHLHGTVAHRDTSRVVIDVGGVGYVVSVADSTAIPARGQPVEVFTSLQVREDSMTLYGFTEYSALEVFELLLHASGVGPKLGLAVLATLSATQVRSALAHGDVATLTTVPGIGKKVADRLVLELQDRVGLDADIPVGGATAPVNAAADDVRDALLGLGYTAGEIAEVLQSLDGDGSSTEVLLRQALQQLSRRVGQGS